MRAQSEDLDISAVVPGAPTPGGGGGSGSQTNKASVVLSGNSFPNARITLLKDGAVSTTLFANPNGTFQITLNNLHFGNYQLTLFAEDSSGNFSSPYTINVGAFSTTPYIYSNILLPPTIKVSPTLIPRGSNFNVNGYVAPGSLVTLTLPGGGPLGTATAGSDGFYSITLSAQLPQDVYYLRTYATLNNITSPFSKPVEVFIYSGQQPPPIFPPRPPSPIGLCVDYNKDGRVNLVDFSILLFWFNKNQPPENIDCNKDNFVDLKDFSVLMYYWTG